jgi:hypothetical protein
MRCKIEGCEGKAVAKGLCAKHYMRQRRSGDAETVKKAGRPVSFWGKYRADEADKVGFLREMSPRTRAKYWKWIDFMGYARDDPKIIEQAFRIAGFKHNQGWGASTTKLEAIAELLRRVPRAEWQELLDTIENDPKDWWWRVHRGNAEARAAARAR